MPRTATTYTDIFAQWTQLSASLSQNPGTLPHLEAHRQELEELITEFQTLSAQQAIHEAAKQDTTRRLQGVLDRGQKLAAFLRSGIRHHFGTRSEKLLEFGLQPYRRRTLPESDSGLDSDRQP